MTGDLAIAAVAYAENAGVLVHPCRPNRKEPILDAWQKLATMDAWQIGRWWQQRPNANIGIACGGPKRLLVVDIDPDKGGEVTFANLEVEHGVLPETVESITPSGGRHVYLVVPAERPMPGNSAGKLGPGIDTRGQGGYVVAPPSTVAGRPYAWSVDSADEMAEAPGWLLDALNMNGAHGVATPPADWLKLITEGVEEGARNHAIARIAGLLLRRLPDPQLAAELVVCWHAVKCRPPLPAEELRRTLDSIAAREMRRRGFAA
jgi:hypothetical protein